MCCANVSSKKKKTLPHLTSLAREYATRRKGDVILDVGRVVWESMIEFEIFDITIFLHRPKNYSNMIANILFIAQP